LVYQFIVVDRKAGMSWRIEDDLKITSPRGLAPERSFTAEKSASSNFCG